MPCIALTRSGKPCRFRTSPAADYCLNHQEPANTSAAASRAARASSHNAKPAPPAIELLDTAMGLHDRASIQAAIDTVTRLALGGQISLERARVVLRACAIASRNFDTSDTLAGRASSAYEAAAYYQKVRAILASIDPMLAKADEADAAAAAAGEEAWLE